MQYHLIEVPWASLSNIEQTLNLCFHQKQISKKNYYGASFFSHIRFEQRSQDFRFQDPVLFFSYNMEDQDNQEVGNVRIKIAIGGSSDTHLLRTV